MSGTVYLKYLTFTENVQLSHRDRAARCVIFLVKSGRLQLVCNILRTSQVYLQPLSYSRSENLSNSARKRKTRVTTAFKVIQGNRGRYQWKAHMRLHICSLIVSDILSCNVGELTKVIFQILNTLRFPTTVGGLRHNSCNWETKFHGHYTSVFNHCDIMYLTFYDIR